MEYYVNGDLFPGGTDLDWAIIGSLNFSMAMVVAPIVMNLIRRYHIRIPMLIGVVLQTTGLITASFATRVWHLYLTQGALVGFGIGCTFIPTMGILAQWFTKRRSLVYGISSAGVGVGGLIFSFGVRWMLSNLTLAWSLRAMGAITCLMTLLATFLIRSRDEYVQPRNRGFDTKLLRRYDCLLLLSWAFIVFLGYMVVLFSFTAFGHSIGLSDNQAASITAFLNLGTALGRPFLGVLSDRFGRIETCAALTFFCGLSIFTVWVPANSYAVCILFAFINGPVFGIFWAVSIPTIIMRSN